MDLEQLKLLCVDDDEGIIKALQRVLKSEDYEVFFASSGQQALELLKNNKIHVVLSDLLMPQMDGIELLTKVKEKYPDVIRLILTGTDDKKMIAQLINSGGIYRYATKPWSNEELKSIVAQGFEYYKINSENRRLVEENKKISEELVEINLRLNSDKENTESLLKIYSEVLDSLDSPLVYIDSFRKEIRANEAARQVLNIKARDTLDFLLSRLNDELKQVLKKYVDVEYRSDITIVKIGDIKFKIKSLGSFNNYMGVVMIGECLFTI